MVRTTIESTNKMEFIYRNIHDSFFLMVVQNVYKEAKLLNLDSMIAEFLISV